MLNIVITGANGQLGSQVCSKLDDYGYSIFPFTSEALDITDRAKIKKILSSINPSIIINCAAYTKVDDAEIEVEICNKVNIDGAKNLAVSAKDHDATLIHFSTDYVFDGNNDEAYKETDKTGALNVYGLSKLKGEKEISGILNKYFIIRTSWVFSEKGKNFFNTMLSLAGKKELKVISDQYGMPSSADSLAELVIKICESVANSKKISFGLYHFANHPVTTWYDFAYEIFKVSKEAGAIENVPKLIKINTIDYASKTKRPMHSGLSTKKIENNFSIKKVFWKSELAKTVKRFLKK